MTTTEDFAARCASASCRSCGHERLDPVLDLGITPLADKLRTREQLNRPEPRYPLEVAFCGDCSLVQILETVPPDVLFGADYPYYSSFSDTLLSHSRENALELIMTRDLGADSLVVEIASNDGYLLKNFVEQGIPVLGIDPTPGPATAAEEIGVTTRNTFFSLELARELVAEGKRADVIVANNVLAHVADTNGLVAGIAHLLADGGVATIEVPCLRDLIKHCEFDTIYHEHLCYFSLTALTCLFQRHGLRIVDVRSLPIHGGSLRLYVAHEGEPTAAVVRLLAEERELGMDRAAFHRDFAQRVEDITTRLVELLRSLREDGRRIAAYGAAAKGATLINYAGIGADTLEFVVDRNVHKQGLFMPGPAIPIRATDALLIEMPDYVLLLAWNFADEIFAQQAEFRARGGRFIVPIPEPRVVEASCAGGTAG